ncbi:MAG: glycosyltransferase [Candidatus Aminicenantes bacterium]|nr:glycosyltransferase [Candidatus Aminicenantes bacterium]
MRTIKVLEVIDKTFLGGGQKNLISLVENLDKETFDVSVCSNPKGRLVNKLEIKNIRHFPVFMSKRFSLKPVREIQEVLRRNKIDIIHTHGGIAGFYGRWAARRFKHCAVVHTLHGIHYLNYRNALLKSMYVWIERIFSKFTHAVIFVSHADKNKGVKYKLASKEKSKLIENGIDFTGIPQTKSKTKNSERKNSVPVIGTVARLHRQKNISLLLQAGARIKNQCPELKVYVVGDGPLRKKLEKQNKKLGTQEVISFLGEREDARRIMSEFDIFVLPSLWEGLPYVLLEAAALKKPVIGTHVDGIKEMITHEKTGLLVSPEKSDELAEAVLRLVNDRKQAEKLGAAFYQSAQRKYSISRMVGKVQDLYVDLFRGRYAGPAREMTFSKRR